MSRAKVHPLIKNLMPKLEGKERVLVLGPLPVSHETLRGICKKLKPEIVFYIDGGLIHKKKFLFNKKVLHFSAGDGDSGQRPDILLPTEKDFSDLAFGLFCLSPLTLSKVALLGFSEEKEKRPDHLLQNLGEVFRFVEKKRIPVLMDSFEFFPPGRSEFSCKGLFSLFAFSKTKVRLTGKVQYQIPDWKALEAFSSFGLSNRGRGNIQLENKKTVVIYRAGENIT